MEVLLIYSHPILNVLWLLKSREEVTQPTPEFSAASLVCQPRVPSACGSHGRESALSVLFCSVLFTMTLVISLAPIRSLRNCTALSQMKLLSFTVASATNKSTASRIFLLA